MAVMPAPETTAVGERILQAAGYLFYERGITATGVDLVADTAETTKRTLYQRFGSKDGLIAAYLAQRAHDWQTYLLDEMEYQYLSTREQALSTLFAISATWATESRRGCAFVNAWAEFGGTGGEIVAVIREEKAWMRELFTRITGSPASAEVIHQLYEGAQVCATIEEDTDAFFRAGTAAVSLLDQAGGSGRVQPWSRGLRRAWTATRAMAPIPSSSRG